MALIQLSRSEAESLIRAIRSVERAHAESGFDSGELPLIRKRLETLQFTARNCLHCGSEFEADNPRKTTCSDRCRQALSRSKRSTSIFVSPFSHTPTATPAAPPHAVPAPPIGQASAAEPLSIKGTLPGCVTQIEDVTDAPIGPRNRKVWHLVDVTVELRPDGTHEVVKVDDSTGCPIGHRQAEGPVTEQEFKQRRRDFIAGMDGAPAGGAIYPHRWMFCFGMHANGTAWVGDLIVPSIALEKARELVTAGA